MADDHVVLASTSPRSITRRRALGVLGAASVLGLGFLAGGIVRASTRPGEAGQPMASPADPTVETPRARAAASILTVDDWRRTRGDRYLIAHRGSGDVLPEHSMEAYQAAVDWGARCLEVSVGLTADGVLVCMHDLTYDRTTTARGRIADQTAGILDVTRIWQPQLGAAWLRKAPRVPRFDDVLRAFGGQVILAVEAKDPDAFEPMLAMIEALGVRDAVIVKAHYSSADWATAQARGYPVFCYFGAAGELTADTIVAAAARLDAGRDCLVIPGFGRDGPYLADELVLAAVRTGVPTWVHPLHRRSDAEHFFGLGVEGAVCSSYGYIAGTSGTVSADSWSAQAIAAGEMTRNPGSASYALDFAANGDLVLGLQGAQHFVTLGQLGPRSASRGYVVGLEAGWVQPPAAPADALCVVFGRPDDSYYEDRLGWGDGCHATLSADGTLGLLRHRHGVPDPIELTAPARTPPVTPGARAGLRVAVSAGSVSVTRTDTGHTIRSVAPAPLDGYVHLGRTSRNGSAVFRALTVT